MRKALQKFVKKIYGAVAQEKNIFIFMPHNDAGIAQLVEHNLAKVGVASSSLVSRSCMKNLAKPPLRGLFVFPFFRFSQLPNPHASHQPGTEPVNPL
jgi:hypothetical protein